MQTPGHVMINLGLLGGPNRGEGPLRDRSRWTWLIVTGALIPDLMLFWFYFWTKAIRGLPDQEIWSQTYWQPGWQDLFAPFNSIPLALIGLGCALYWKRGAITALFASMILHCLQDLPLHHDDAHRHFWPLSNFRFESPVSYWDPAHHAAWGALFEVICVLGATLVLLSWVRSPWGKGILIVLAVLYVILYGSFYGPLLFSPAT